HAHAAGYDMTSEAAYIATWNEFDQVIGFKYLSGMHLNDTLKALGSKVDRHAPIAKGVMGETFWRLLMNDSRMDNIPLILETPDESIWAEEIKWLYSLID
ncbi:MAG: TIM barrel protein, partial [Duncaniella sp.]|nr:TIM barrel protein [Duncaniella sp.]